MTMWKLRAFATTTLALGLMGSPAKADDKVLKDLPGPIDSLEDLQDTGRMLFLMADDNKDGQISQQEAIDAAFLVVGGQFFRADKDGNGAVSKEEAQQARASLLAQKPLLRVAMQRIQSKNPDANATARNAEQGMMSLVDTNNDGQIQSAELKQVVQTTVQSVYAMADTNRDGQMSPTEVNAALAGAARSAVQAAFQQADADSNGQLSQAEYDKAIVQPANAVFSLLDANADGQISPQEFQTAERALASQLRRLNVPEPANSASNLIESRRRPAEVAPVPNFNASGTRPAPAPAQQPTAPAQPRQ